jgi:UDP-N-acetylmuramate--alanine ligase
MKIGIFFGGSSREREVSFAGGRTVYDNLDKSLFEPVPVFVDSFGNFVLLDWKYIYKGSIRDFYPPASVIPKSLRQFQLYAESLADLSSEIQEKMLAEIGTKILPQDFKKYMDFAFLALHGERGEDGTIQGLLDWLGIPYSGSGILPSAIGIDKSVQKQIQINAGFNSPRYLIIEKENFSVEKASELLKEVNAILHYPLVVKSATQGSSIGISVLRESDPQQFLTALHRSFFTEVLALSDWRSMDIQAKFTYLQRLADIRESIGYPVIVNGGEVIYGPQMLATYLDENFAKEKDDRQIYLEGLQSETRVIIEEFIEGREFSCIVIQDESGRPIALPPTEIVKGKEVYDYRSKYLPGLSRKITPIDLPEAVVEEIRLQCSRMFSTFNCNVYARIDGFIKADHSIYLNDPNTTSGMLPSSFFFHQAAEIGLNPSQFITYIIHTSLAERIRRSSRHHGHKVLLKQAEEALEKNWSEERSKVRIAVILGGYSSERHISVESGRNIYEKLSSSGKYKPVPVFLTGSDQAYELYRIPVNIMLKDNADDIAEKVKNYHSNQLLEKIRKEFAGITYKYSRGSGSDFEPVRIPIEKLADMAEGVFVALHGRPGEDGSIQQELEKLGLPYNGSGVETSRITINKFETNELLRKNGFLVADHLLVSKDEWKKDPEGILERTAARLRFPLIAKPADDGCSSAVKKIKTLEELKAYAAMIFAETENHDPRLEKILKLLPKEEFPRKEVFLAESFIEKGDAKHFLEITGGLLTHTGEDGSIAYEMFEPSETLAEKEILSLEEKFLAGQGQNITPARYDSDMENDLLVSTKVKQELEKAARLLNLQGYARIDAFVRIFSKNEIEVIFIEVNSLPGMTPATCIFHQCAINGYKPFDFIDEIISFGFKQRQPA